MTDRVFLDANILVSAVWRPDSGLLALWDLPETQLITSAYALLEADRNVSRPDQRTRLYVLVQAIEIVDEAADSHVPASVTLPAKDVPILLAAIQARAAFLLTGDKRHFGGHFGRRIEGVTVLRPRDYLLRRDRPRDPPPTE